MLATNLLFFLLDLLALLLAEALASPSLLGEVPHHASVVLLALALLLSLLPGTSISFCSNGL